MNYYIQQFRQHFSDNQPNYGFEDIHSLLALLSSIYMTYNPINTDEVSVQFQALDPLLATLSKKRRRKVLNLIHSLCSDYEKSAFLEGMRVGAQLFIELSES